ncbi:MAG TPA: hypothetical protein VH478_04410 [Trebonia sp.]|nr:hypothetical protein [Trebonia sp.]
MSTRKPQPCSPGPCPPAPHYRKNWLARSASAIGGVLREMDYAQRQALRARQSFNTIVPEPREAPDTFREFLLRTAAPGPHEPTARQRAGGRRIRLPAPAACPRGQRAGGETVPYP